MPDQLDSGKWTANALEAAGFNIGFEQMRHFLLLEQSAAMDSADVVESVWTPAYDVALLVELSEVANRYVLLTDHANRTQEVGIRGTENLKNAFYDIEFVKSESKTLGIRLHSGFDRVAQALHKDLVTRLIPGYSVSICGHSLGAAEALILGMYLTRDGVQVTRVVATGPPKVTDANGWRKFQALPVILVGAAYDPVPFLPPRNLLYAGEPYAQKQRVLMLLDGPYMTIASPSFYDDLPDAVKEVRAAGREFTVPSHRIWNYVKRLQEKQNGIILVPLSSWEDHAAPIGD